jgi:hypothetical protein
MKLRKSLLCNLCNSRRIIGYLQKLLYTVNRIRMSPTPTLYYYSVLYLFEGPTSVIFHLINDKNPVQKKNNDTRFHS